MKRLRIGFVMSTEVGLRTQFLNWQRNLTPDLGIDPDWIAADWWHDEGLIERVPLVPDGAKARFRSQFDVRAGLNRGPFDGLFVAQERMLHGMNPILLRQPYFIAADVTAAQLARSDGRYAAERLGFEPYERRKHDERADRFRAAAALFPWSQWAGQSMVADYGVERNRIHVIPPGVDLATWSQSQAAKPAGDSPVNILFVGGDFHRKGGDLLLEWAMETDRRGWMLHIVTRDLVVPPRSNIRVYNSLAPDDNALRRLYSQADIFALPARVDCYSIAAVEALAAGLPVILSRIGGAEDIVCDGKTGYLIDPEDRHALDSRLNDLLDHPEMRTGLGRAARADAEQRYDARKNIAATVQIMRSCLPAASE